MPETEEQSRLQRAIEEVQAAADERARTEKMERYVEEMLAGKRGSPIEACARALMDQLNSFNNPWHPEVHRWLVALQTAVTQQEQLRAAISDEDIAREYFEHGWFDAPPPPKWSELREDVKNNIRAQVRGVREAMRRLGIA